MKNGDISNKTLPTVLFRLEDTVLHEKSGSIKDKVVNLAIGKLNNSLLDVNVMSYIYKLARNTEYSVVLGVDSNSRFDVNTFGLNDFEIKPLHDIQHIKFLLDSGLISYYLDENKERISVLSNDKAMSIDDFRHISGVK